MKNEAKVMKVKFYRCNHCGNIIMFNVSSGVPVVCCGEKMQELVANTTDGAVEKHVPAVSVEGNTANVVIGSVVHPMTEEHYIQFIAAETKQGVQIKYLKPGDEPKATFVLSEGDELVCVYEYCNLHGLWRA